MKKKDKINKENKSIPKIIKRIIIAMLVLIIFFILFIKIDTKSDCYEIASYISQNFNDYSLVDGGKDNEYEYSYVESTLIYTKELGDTDDNTYYDSQKNHHFKFFSQKDSQTISDNEIYNLNQTNGWIWHMWYKRAIENYFPKERYEKLSVSIDEDEISDYENIGQKYKSKGYKKEMVPKLAKDMSRTMYERGLKHFTVNGIDMSEMQLLLLKFAKIV